MSDSVSSESKPKPCFSHLPWFLRQRIVDKTDFITRCRLRKVSKELAHRVDKSPLGIKEVMICLSANAHYLRIITDQSLEVIYGNEIIPARAKLENGIADLGGPDPVRRLVRDLATLFRNRNTTLDQLMFGYSSFRTAYLTGGQYPKDRAVLHETFKQEFDKIPHQLKVGALKTVVLTEDDVMLFVPYLKPGVLKQMIPLIVNSDGVLQEVKLARVKETEQWKQSETSKKD